MGSRLAASLGEPVMEVFAGGAESGLWLGTGVS